MYRNNYPYVAPLDITERTQCKQMLNATPEERKEAQEKILMSVLPYINDTARSTFPGGYQYYDEDMVQESLISLLLQLDNYDPANALTTFAKFPILNGCKKAIAGCEGTSLYDFNTGMSLKKKLDRANLDIDDPTEAIMEATGYGQQRVDRAKAVYHSRHCSELDETYDAPGYVTPDRVMFESENYRIFARALDELEPPERYYLTHHEGIYHSASNPNGVMESKRSILAFFRESKCWTIEDYAYSEANAKTDFKRILEYLGYVPELGLA